MRVVWAVVALVLLAACSSDPEPLEPAPTTQTPTPTPTPTFAYPAKEWAKQPQGDFKAQDRYLGGVRSTCFAVIKDGKLAHDAYWGGTGERSTRPAYSITKSVTAILVGIAADEGKLKLDDKASKYIPQWQGNTARDVTIRDLLSNTSGRHWDYNTDYSQMVRRAPDKTAFAIGLRQDNKPGTKWDYNNSAVQTLEAVLQKATGEDVAAYAKKRLLDPIGMRDTTWAHDNAGNTTTYSGIDSSCHDLARIGYLMMRGGKWNGKQLVSEQFTKDADEHIEPAQRRIRAALVGQQARPHRHDRPRRRLPAGQAPVRGTARPGRTRRHVLGARIWQRVRHGDPVRGRRRRTHGIASQHPRSAHLRVVRDRRAQGCPTAALG